MSEGSRARTKTVFDHPISEGIRDLTRSRYNHTVERSSEILGSAPNLSQGLHILPLNAPSIIKQENAS